MKAKTLKNIIANVPDDADIWIEVKPDDSWEQLKSITIQEINEEDDPVQIYLNYSD